jgi:hypothetical protein
MNNQNSSVVVDRWSTRAVLLPNSRFRGAKLGTMEPVRLRKIPENNVPGAPPQFLSLISRICAKTPPTQSTSFCFPAERASEVVLYGRHYAGVAAAGGSAAINIAERQRYMESWLAA